MTKKLSLFYPCKPLVINQAFGIKNDSYLKYGFSRHNGIDYKLDADSYSVAMCDGLVVETGYNNGAGNYIKYQTDLVNCEGVDCYVQFFYMHGKTTALVKEGTRVKAGDKLLITGTTGNSTGIHTHISAYRIGLDGYTRLDKDPETDHCFDFSKFYNGYHADDIPILTPILEGLAKALAQAVAYFKSL